MPGTRRRPEEEAISLFESMNRSWHGKLKYAGEPVAGLFYDAANKLEEPGIYLMGLFGLREEYGHAVAFVHYRYKKQRVDVSEYRFLGPNTGEFAWNDPAVTGDFF